MTTRTTIGLVDQRARKEEYFTLEPDKIAVFNPRQFQTDGKIKKLTPTNETDYKVVRAALRFFSESTLGFTANDLLIQLTAGNKYSPELKERTIEILAKRMIGTLDLGELKHLAQAIIENKAIGLKPFLICNLLHCRTPFLDACDIDPKIVALAKELRAINERDDESDKEFTRHEIQTVLNERGLDILRITNRYENVPNPAESIDLSNLLGCFEHMDRLFNNYIKEEQVPSFSEVMFGVKGEDNMAEIAKQMKEARRIFKTLKEIRPEMVSEVSAQRRIEENEKVIVKSMEELNKVLVTSDKPIGFTTTSFTLCPGIELGYLFQKSILWISAEKFDAIDEELVQTIFETLQVEKLAIGTQIFAGDPMIEYYSYKANHM